MEQLELMSLYAAAHNIRMFKLKIVLVDKRSAPTQTLTMKADRITQTAKTTTMAAGDDIIYRSLKTLNI